MRRSVLVAIPLLLLAAYMAGNAQSQRQESPARFDALLSAAFAEFAAGKGYAELHHRYLGVTQPAPNPSACAAWPGEVASGSRNLRLGYIVEEPLHQVDSAGRHFGFEADLAAELIRRINARYRNAALTLEWVRVDATLPVGPAKNRVAFMALAEGLRAGKFDVAFSSIVPLEAPDIAYLCPTMTMFPGVVYTGRDNLDVKGIRDRKSLVEFLAAHKGMTFVHGMGAPVYDALAADVAKAGGAISLATDGMPHFRMADILGVSKQGFGAAFPGVVLDVNPRLDIQPKSVFALKP
jgi:ABC-type amino acid transport substrate-binding protein